MTFNGNIKIILLISGKAILISTHNIGFHEEMAKIIWGEWWLSGRASDSGSRVWGFENYLGRVVSLSKTLYSPKVLVIPRKLWLRPDMTDWDVKPQHKIFLSFNYHQISSNTHLISSSVIHNIARGAT